MVTIAGTQDYVIPDGFTSADIFVLAAVVEVKLDTDLQKKPINKAEVAAALVILTLLIILA